ncbi:MAG: response regulator [Armatimonadetes bacterium]|nr:response regulator [Armatimonadota bacterium]
MADLLDTRVLLLVEDNPGDADLVVELLEESGSHYKVLRATRMSEAVDKLKNSEVDVVLLDLRLPDSSGLDSLREIKSVAEQIPIVILTGLEDESLAMECINAGVQDYLAKSELKPISLKRTIGYAITRLREAQLRELQGLLDRYRTMSTGGSTTTVTSGLLGSAPVKERLSGEYDEFVAQYERLMKEYLDLLILKKEKPREQMEYMVTRLGDAGSGPRDLIDVHLEALDRASHGHSHERTRFLIVEGRLLALEMMGLLVDYYRTGSRRQRTWQGQL